MALLQVIAFGAARRSAARGITLYLENLKKGGARHYGRRRASAAEKVSADLRPAPVPSDATYISLARSPAGYPFLPRANGKGRTCVRPFKSPRAYHTSSWYHSCTG